MKPFRSILPLLALAAGLAGCSTPAAPGSTGADTATVEPPPSTPGTEPSGVEPPRAGDHGVSISIPRLPIGGNADPDGPQRQCATAGWLQPEVFPEGGVTVTEVTADPPEGYRVGGGCGGLRGCAGFTFRPGGGRCSVAVTGPGTPDAQLKFAGVFTCAPARESSCRELLPQVNPGSIGLSQPEETTGPESSATEAPPTSAESSPSPTG
ncbi:hypothetical protein [Amycolatopsis sp. NPDC021455]|uniref:hypothetical protein n=1 Tax=Amycolatopsis sp. NPDC021455 TaxID=3154901 RepID=UPI0033E3EBD6